MPDGDVLVVLLLHQGTRLGQLNDYAPSQFVRIISMPRIAQTPGGSRPSWRIALFRSSLGYPLNPTGRDGHHLVFLMLEQMAVEHVHDVLPAGGRRPAPACSLTLNCTP